MPHKPFTQSEQYRQIPVIDKGIVFPLRKQLVSKKPGVARVEGDLVIFEDGSDKRFDALIFTTG